MKKLLAVLFCFCMVSVLFANGQQEQINGQEKIKLEIFQFKVEIIEQLDALIKDFELEHPEIDVEIETVGGGADYSAALRLKITSGEEPGIFNFEGPSRMVEWMDYLEPLNDQPWVARCFPGTLDMGSMSGNVYGQPYGQEGYGLIYNKKILAKAGYSEYDLAEIDTLDEFRALFADLESQKDDLGIMEVLSFSIGGTAWWTASQHNFNSFLAHQDNPKQYAEDLKYGKANFSDNKLIDSYLDMLDLFFEYSYKNLVVVEYNDQVSNFAMGKTAFVHQGNWTLGMITEIDPDMEMAFLPLPIGDCQSVLTGVPSYWAVNKNKSPEEIAAAKTFLDYMASSERGQKFIVEEAKFIPAYKVELEPSDPLAQSILDFSSRGKTVPWMWMHMPVGFCNCPTSPVLEAIQNYYMDKDREAFCSSLDQAYVDLNN